MLCRVTFMTHDMTSPSLLVSITRSHKSFLVGLSVVFRDGHEFLQILMSTTRNIKLTSSDSCNRGNHWATLFHRGTCWSCWTTTALIIAEWCYSAEIYYLMIHGWQQTLACRENTLAFCLYFSGKSMSYDWYYGEIFLFNWLKFEVSSMMTALSSEATGSVRDLLQSIVCTGICVFLNTDCYRTQTSFHWNL